MKNVTVEVLKEIRNELGELRSDVGDLRRDMNEQLSATSERLTAVERRQLSSETRVATEIVAVVAAIHQLRDVIVADRAVREQVHDHELRITSLERRTG